MYLKTILFTGKTKFIARGQRAKLGWIKKKKILWQP